MEKRTFKNKIYHELATVVKALSNPNRLEILELLAQGPFAVDDIADQTDMTTANASQHLQVMKRVQLVDTRRDGNRIFYSLADENVYKAWKALRDLGIQRIAEVERIIREFRESKSSMESLSSIDLINKMKQEEITIIDVRPEHEFNQGHISGAVNIPVDNISDRLTELPDDEEIIAYCRGPFCVFADEAVELLNKEGYNARRLDEGFPEWMLEGLPVENEHE